VTRRILISTRCTTPLLGSALRGLLEGDRIEESGVEEAVSAGELAARLDGTDVWVRHADGWQQTADPEVARIVSRLDVVHVPIVKFAAFHPDLSYAVRPGGELVTPHYHSTIAIWAWRNGLSPPVGRRLYCDRVFSALGYYARWPASVELLRRRFEACGLDFPRFFLGVKRTGAFMHAINHPKAATVVALAKAIAVRLGANERVWGRELEIADPLGELYQWPIYPEVGRHFALPGSYDWVIRGRRYGLGEFLERSFSDYGGGIDIYAPAEVRAEIDRVLKREAREVLV
jgi:hypothetical protein